MTTVRTPDVAHPTRTAPVGTSRAATANRYVAAAIRLRIGSVFLWAFFRQAARPRARDAGRERLDRRRLPDRGLPHHAVKGPFADAYRSIAGDP